MKQLGIVAALPLLTIVFAQVAWSQTAEPVFGDIAHLELDYATGEITTPNPGADTLVPSCYDNSAFSGFFTTIGVVGDEFVDWGLKSCSLSGNVCEFVFGYGTTALDPGAGGPGASVDIAFYPGYAGLCGALPAPAAVYSFSGLPGSPDGVTAAAFTITVDISSSGFAALDGALGWSYIATDSVSGPLLISTSGLCGGPGDPLTGTEDCFDLYSGGACVGTFAFGTPGIASFWMEIGEDDGSFGPGTSTLRVGACCTGASWCPAGPPPGVSGWLNGVYQTASPVAAAFVGISTLPDATGCIPGLGQVLINTTPPNPITAPVTKGSNSIPVPPNCALIGASLTSQVLGVTPSGFELTDTAIDFTIGSGGASSPFAFSSATLLCSPAAESAGTTYSLSVSGPRPGTSAEIEYINPATGQPLIHIVVPSVSPITVRIPAGVARFTHRLASLQHCPPPTFSKEVNVPVGQASKITCP